jgi:hypothetical protein
MGLVVELVEDKLISRYSGSVKASCISMCMLYSEKSNATIPHAVQAATAGRRVS